MSRSLTFLFIVVVFFTACTQAAPPTTTLVPPTQTTVPTITPVPPTQTTIPTYTPNPFPNPVLKIVGEEEIVFDWTTDRCEKENIPDLAARAFRDGSNYVHLLISHYVNYQMLGFDLNNLTSDCSPAMYSDYNADPSAYSDSEWLASPYTEDGRTVYALVHNEYRGLGHMGPCPLPLGFENCLDTSITLAISTDSGSTFVEVAQPPQHLVSTLPYQALVGAGPFGMRNPSNIIKGEDGYYYAFSNISEYDTQNQWVCLMRTDDLSDPQSWRFWDGNDFEGRFINPYVESSNNPKTHECAPLEWDDIGASLNESITYNTYLNRYVLVGNSADRIGGKEVWGFYYSFSEDLIHWTRRKLLVEMPLPWTVSNPGRDSSVLYPTLIDPNSESRNFETAGKNAYLYYTRMNFGAGSLDRDLIRVAVEFFPSP